MNSVASDHLLTIAIPTFQRSAMVEAQVTSLLDHLPDGVEILVLDNGSDDSTAQAIAGLAALDNRVRLHRNRVNLGVDVNTLRAIELSRGGWCWLLGDDEAIDPSELPALTRQLRQTTASVAHLVAPGARLTADSVFFFADPEALVRGFYDLGRLSHLSSTILRVDVALPHVRSAYGSCGLLHSYSSVAARMLVAGGALEVFRLPVLIPSPSRNAPRWNSLHAHLGAWQTLREAFPERIRSELDSRQARCRFRAIFLAALLDSLGARDYSLAGADLVRLARMAPLHLLPGIAVLAVARWAQWVPTLAGAVVVLALRVVYRGSWRSHLARLYGNEIDSAPVARVAAALRKRASRVASSGSGTY